MRLMVYGKLRTGQCMHCLMFGIPPTTKSKHIETYDISKWHILLLDIVELFCGYYRVKGFLGNYYRKIKLWP